MSNRAVSATLGSQRAGVRAHVVRALVLPLSLGSWLPATGANDPTDAATRVPPVVYVSPLPGAVAATPQRVGSWRDANDLTGRIGGWRAYAREAQDRGSGAAVPGAATAPPAAPVSPAAARAAPAASSPAPAHKH
jgi:hypothetical protein